jgi:hypothetical protein
MFFRFALLFMAVAAAAAAGAVLMMLSAAYMPLAVNQLCLVHASAFRARYLVSMHAARRAGLNFPCFSAIQALKYTIVHKMSS